MVTGALVLSLVLLVFLLVASIYQIFTTPLTAVDAPTLAKSAAAPSAQAPAQPVTPPPVPAVPSTYGPARRTSPPGPPRRLPAWTAAALAITGLAAVILGGGLFLRVAHVAPACAQQAIEICSQGYVLLTSTQLAGAGIAVVGFTFFAIAVVRALR